MPKKKKNPINSNKVNLTEDIWGPFRVTNEEIKDAYSYATVSLPWTFDRMHYGPRTQKAVNNRLVHIFIGVLNQTILEHVLRERGFTCSKEWKNYRDCDVFDFRIKDKTFDVKTIVLYKKFDESVKRETFSKDLLIKYKDYDGPEWRKFFPMMVPTTQLTVDRIKDAYIFGIAETFEDLRSSKSESNTSGYWCSVPFDDKTSGRAHSFLQNSALITEREKNQSGFRIKLHYKMNQATLDSSAEEKVNITLFGEWNKEKQTEVLELNLKSSITSIKEYSSLCCVQIDNPQALGANQIDVTVQNNFGTFISKYNDPSININDPHFKWTLFKNSFVNLFVPPDYQVNWIGYISYKEFGGLFSKYPSYFIPKGNDMSINQEGRSNNKLEEKFRALDNRRKKAIDKGKDIPWPEFLSLVGAQKSINAGILISATKPDGKVIGAACYYYPPYALQESALYILPKDLNSLNSLHSFLS